MGKYVDVKVTVWQRLHFNEDADMDQIAKMIQENAGVNGVCEDEYKYSHLEWLDETEEMLPPDENNGCSTIEVYKDDKTLWENGKACT